MSQEIMEAQQINKVQKYDFTCNLRYLVYIMLSCILIGNFVVEILFDEMFMKPKASLK